MSYKKLSTTEWTWQKGTRHHSVRYFESTQKLIWSGWADTTNGAVFEEGYTQSVENFLQDGVSHLSPPEDLVNDLRQALEKHSTKKSSGLFSWFKRRS